MVNRVNPKWLIRISNLIIYNKQFRQLVKAAFFLRPRRIFFLCNFPCFLLDANLTSRHRFLGSIMFIFWIFVKFFWFLVDISVYISFFNMVIHVALSFSDDNTTTSSIVAQNDECTALKLQLNSSACLCYPKKQFLCYNHFLKDTKFFRNIFGGFKTN